MSIVKSICLILFVSIAYAASAQKGYLLIDSAYTTGFIENQGKKLNSLEVKFRKSSSSPVTVYQPATATEYGFNNNVYRSRKILTGTDSTSYFLYVLSKGDVNLYIVKLDGKKRFFAENEKEFVELTKENKTFHQQISDLFEKCEAYKNTLPSLRFKEKSLRRFFTLQNACYNKGPWPLLRWSGIAGFSSTSLTITSIYGDEINMGDEAGVFFGVGLESPLGTRPNWSIMIQPSYQQNHFQKTVVQRIQGIEIRTSKYDIKTSTISIPFQVKYAVPFKEFKGFVSLGPTLGYNLKNDSFMDENIETSGGTTTNEDSSDLVTKTQIAGAAGLGIEYFITDKFSISLEGRFSTGQGFGTDAHSVSAKQILIAVNF